MNQHVNNMLSKCLRRVAMTIVVRGTEAAQAAYAKPPNNLVAVAPTDFPSTPPMSSRLCWSGLDKHHSSHKEIEMSSAKQLHAWMFALAPILTGALSGCATFGKCESDSCHDDTNITRNIRAELDQHRALESNAISVQTHDHVVYLYGLVASGLEGDTAAAIAHEQPGVSEVVNSIALNN